MHKQPFVFFVLALLLSPELSSVAEAVRISSTTARMIDYTAAEAKVGATALGLGVVLPVLSWWLLRRFAPQALGTARTVAIVLLVLFVLGFAGYAWSIKSTLPPPLKYTLQSPRSPRVNNYTGPRDLHLVTVATRPERMFDLLKQSAQNHSVQLEVLGWGQQWTGLMMKFDLMTDYLKTLAPNAIVCFVDGFDSLLMSNGSEIVDKFLGSGYDALLSRDRIIYTGDNLPGLMFDYMGLKVWSVYTENRLNSGMYVGFASTLQKIMDRMRNCTEEDDQRCLNSEVGYLNEINAAMDADGQIVANIVFDNYNVTNGRVVTPQGTQPCVVSFPGAVYTGVSNKLLKQLSLTENSATPSTEVISRAFWFASEYFEIEVLLLSAILGTLLLVVLSYLAPGARFREIQKAKKEKAKLAKAKATATAKTKTEVKANRSV